MATTLIDTRKSIMPQIHASWNESRSSDKTIDYMFGPAADWNSWHNIQLAKDFTAKDAPWSSKQTVLERNTVHANKLIRLYISLNIDVAYRMPIWQFFEIENGIVGKIKEQIKLLKRIQKVLKLEQELEIHEPLPNATSLFTHTAHLSLANIEEFCKLKVKEAKKLAAKEARAQQKAIAEAKRRNAALRRAKKEQKRKDVAKENKKALKRTADWIQANKHGKTNVLKMLKTMERDGYTIKDVIEELERQLH
jgi:hypothetical protein